jgi:peptide/nickel transport system permease protein
MSRRSYVVRRTLRWVVLLWLLTTIIFVMFRLMPGNPLGYLVGGSFTEATKQRLLAEFGLNKPVHVQYVLYMENLLLDGEFGVSFHYGESVLNIIVPRMINTLLIMVPAMTMVMVFAYVLGSHVGWRRGERIDVVGSYLLVAVRSLPHFVLGLFLLIIFSYQLDVLPIGGMGPIGTSWTVTEMLTSPVFYQHWLLPFTTAFLFFLADPFLLMRGNMVTQKSQDYVELLRLKGLPEKRVQDHASKNALLPLVTYLTPAVAISFGAQILIEVVFSWPGIGRALVLAVQRNDYPVAQGAFFIIGFLVITTNLFVDFLYAYVDPRIQND